MIDALDNMSVASMAVMLTYYTYKNKETILFLLWSQFAILQIIGTVCEILD